MLAERERLSGRGNNQTREDERHDSPVELQEENEVQIIEGNIIRFILSKELKSQLIRREHLSQFYSKRRLNHDAVFPRIQRTLQEIYGLTLTPVRAKESQKGGKNVKSKQAWILTTFLSSASKEVLGDLWLKRCTFPADNHRGPLENAFFLPRYEKSPSIMSATDLLKSGILSLILVLIIISENHLSETELERQLHLFGINTSSDYRNSSYNLTTTELLSEFVKKDYLVKETSAALGSDHVEYSLGPRTVIEFPPLSVYNYVKAIYGDAFDTEAKERLLCTVQGVYKSSLAEDLASLTANTQEGQ